jgi:hypothetical protein
MAAVVGGVLALGACGGEGTERTPSATSQSTHSPSASPTRVAAPARAPVGYLPVDSYAASDIPWDKVGPGWFLVEWRESEYVFSESPPFAAADDAVSLLAPNGDWYLGADLEPTGATASVMWLGAELAIFRDTVFQPDWWYGETSVLNLKDGSVRVVLGVDSPDPEWYAVAAGGRLIGYQFGGADSSYSVYESFANPREVCWGAGIDLKGLAPDGKRLICLSYEPIGDGSTTKTAVTVAGVSSAKAPEKIDVFKRDPNAYSLAGWLDGDTFLLAVTDGSATTYFSYNIATRKIADLPLPFDDPATISFDYTSQTFAAQDESGVRFYSRDGSALASVSCGPASLELDGLEYSGPAALVQCSAGSSDTGWKDVVTYVDLASGATSMVAAPDVQKGQGVLKIYGYPANL